MQRGKTGCDQVLGWSQKDVDTLLGAMFILKCRGTQARPPSSCCRAGSCWEHPRAGARCCTPFPGGCCACGDNSSPKQRWDPGGHLSILATKSAQPLLPLFCRDWTPRWRASLHPQLRHHSLFLSPTSSCCGAPSIGRCGSLLVGESCRASARTRFGPARDPEPTFSAWL